MATLLQKEHELQQKVTGKKFTVLSSHLFQTVQLAGHIQSPSCWSHLQLDQGRICGQMQDVSTDKGKSSGYSAMPRARGLKFYYVIADPKVGE